MQRATQRSLGHKRWQRVFTRALDFADAFSELRFAVREAEMRVQIAFCVHREQRAIAAAQFVAREHQSTFRGARGELVHV